MMGFTAVCPNKIQLSCGKNRSFWWGLVVRSAGTTERVFSTSSARVVQTQWGWLIVGCYLIIPPLHPIAVSYIYMYYIYISWSSIIILINCPYQYPHHIPMVVFVLFVLRHNQVNEHLKQELAPQKGNWVQMSHGSAIDCLVFASGTYILKTVSGYFWVISSLIIWWLGRLGH